MAMRTLWKILRGFAALIGFIVIALAVAGALSLHHKEEALPKHVVMSFTFYGTPADEPARDGLMAQFVPSDPTMGEVTDALYAAAKDPRVDAFVAKLASGDYKWADVQELRSAIAAFRASGKKTYVYAESYGELYPGMAEYYLASAFDQIWIQPIGTVAITGFSAEAPYFKSVLDKIGVQADVIQKGTYKTAPESALLDHMSDAQRDTLHSIISSMMTDFFEGVAQGRKIPADRIGALIDAAPYTAAEAKERKLVDEVGYIDQLEDQLVPADDDTDEKGFVDAVDYVYAAHASTLDKVVKEEKQLTKMDTRKNAVALVYISGLIVSDDAQSGGLMSDRAAYASDIAGAIADASDDDDIKAIVLRVDSPGGSPGASETIRRAVEVARAKGKYVVVSMGSEAASGGYWVVVDADRIYAQPGTLTGSIGVFGGKASFAGLWSKLGVNWDSVSMGANAGLWSFNAPYSDDQRAAVNHMLDDVYDAFVARVAKGRHFAPEVVEGMAQGRVWTGRQAKANGLIDDLGGLRQAFEDIAKNIGVDDVRKLDVIVMPAPPSPLEALMGIFTQGAQSLEIVRPFLTSLAVSRHPELGMAHRPMFEIRP